MSSVTDLVFITPDIDWDNDGPDRCPRFEEILGRHNLSCPPVEDHGRKVPHTAVYYVGGLNHIDQDVIDDIKAVDWPAGSVLYVHHEQDSTPSVTVFGIAEEARHA